MADTDPIREILDGLTPKGPLSGGIVWPPQSPKGGGASGVSHRDEQRGSTGTPVTGPVGDRRNEGNHPDEPPAGPPSEAPIWAAAAHAAAAGHLEPMPRGGTVRPPSTDEQQTVPAGLPIGDLREAERWQQHPDEPWRIIAPDGWQLALCEGIDTAERIVHARHLAEEHPALLERLRLADTELALLRQVALLAPRPPWFKTDTGGYVRALDALDAYVKAREVTTE